jgi:hypothetical protein
MRFMTAGTALVMASALALGACAGDDESAAGKDDESAAVTTSTTPTRVGEFDLAAFCAVFEGIADRARAEGGTPGAGPGGGGPAQPTSEAGWDVRIQMTARIATVAPPELVDNARTYLELVEDRAQLAAENGYVLVADLPPDVRRAFIADHRDEQAQANELIAYATGNCDLG